MQVFVYKNAEEVARAAATGLRPRMTYPRFRYAFPKRGASAGKGQPQGVPAGALISRS